MWEKTAESDRPQMTILHTRFAWWKAKTTDAHSEYVIPFAFHGNNGYTKAPQYYVYTSIASLVNNVCLQINKSLKS